MASSAAAAAAAACTALSPYRPSTQSTSMAVVGHSQDAGRLKRRRNRFDGLPPIEASTSAVQNVLASNSSAGRSSSSRALVVPHTTSLIPYASANTLNSWNAALSTHVSGGNAASGWDDALQTLGSSGATTSSSAPSTTSSVSSQILQEQLVDVATLSGQLVAADLVSLSLRTGLPVNIVKRSVLRWRRSHLRQTQLKQGCYTSNRQSMNVANKGSNRRPQRRRRNRPPMEELLLNSSQQQQQPRGLKNHGQTCFLNSVLQALASSKPFLVYLDRVVRQLERMDELSYLLGSAAHEGKEGNEGKGSISELLVDILLYVNGIDNDDDGGSRSTTDATTLYRKRSNDVRELLRRVGREHAQFRSRSGGLAHVGTEQQDAQELLQALIAMVEAEASPTTMTGNGGKGNDHASCGIGGLLSPIGSDAIDDGTSISVVSACHSEDQRLMGEEACGEFDGLPSIDLMAGLSEDGGVAPEVLTFSGILDMEQTLSTAREETTDLSLPLRGSCSRREEKKDDDEGQLVAVSSVRTGSIPVAIPKKQFGDPSVSQSKAHRNLQTQPLAPVSPLTGWLGSTVQCCRCKHIRPITNQSFLEIPIVPTCIGSGANPLSPLPACSLQQCLREFSSSERVHDVECQYCPIKAEIERLDEEAAFLRGAIDSVAKISQDNDGLQRELGTIEARIFRLKSANIDSAEDAPDSSKLQDGIDADEDDRLPPPIRGDANKCLLFSRAPQVLCFHIQRRYYAAPSDRMLKAMQIVVFPEVMDMAPFCAYSRSTSVLNSMLYRLFAVIEHRGNAHAGHYVTYRRTASGQWVLLSDESITRVTWDDVQRSQAYMLFYECDLPVV